MSQFQSELTHEEPSHIEHGYHKHVASNESCLDINLPRSNGYVYNSRHQKLHFRMFYQHNRPIKSLIVYLHGYSRHCHNPHLVYLAEHAVASHCAIAFLDFHGHGYSEGLKAFVEQPEDLVDDVASLLNFLYDVHTDLNRSGFNSHPSALTDVNETFDPFYSLIANSVPFYLFGMSMGGGTALQMGLNLQAATEVPHASLFQGCILLAPAIETRLPSALTTLVFEHIMVPLFPDVCMPASVGGKNHEAVWDSQDFITYVSEKDNYDPENNPHGMSFNNPIRYGTASSILKLMAGVMGHLGSVAFPFLIFHDPEDNVTMYSGSQQLYERSATLPQNKRLIAMSNGKHDLIINRLAFVVEKSFEWIASHDNCHWRGCSGVGITSDINNSNNGSISSKSSNHRKSVGIFGTAVGASPRTTKRKQAGTAQMDIASTANVNSNAAAGLQTGPVPIAVEPVAAAPEPVARRVRTRRIKQ